MNNFRNPQMGYDTGLVAIVPENEPCAAFAPEPLQ